MTNKQREIDMIKGDGLYNLSLRDKAKSVSSGAVLAVGGVLITLLILLYICTPLLVLLALNTLFPVLAIPYNLYTWLATAFLWWVSSRKTIVNLFNK